MSLKKTFYQTTYTAIPSHIPRQLAIDLLQNHSEIIELSPLVIGHHAIKAPPKASADEYYSTWYDIQQRIQFIPGTGKAGASKIHFEGVFHDLPNGLQTHVYPPGGIDLRHKYTINGNQPGEPVEAKELGSGAPTSGLYLKEEVEIRCNIMMIGFVKKELRAATDILIARLVKKAELVDAGILHAMFDQGRLTTVNPANRTSTIPIQSPGLASNFPQSPRSSQIPYQSPRLPGENGNFTAELPGAQSGARQSLYGSQSGQPSPRGLGFELPADQTYPAQQRLPYRQQSGSQSSNDRGSYHEMSAYSAQQSQASQQSTNRSTVYEMAAEPLVSQQQPNLDARSYGNPPIQQTSYPQHHSPVDQTTQYQHRSPVELKTQQHHSPVEPSPYHKPPEMEEVQPLRDNSNANNRYSQPYPQGSERIKQLARRGSWEPDDDKK